MTTSPDLQRYFVSEAGECLDALDSIVVEPIPAQAGTAVVSSARALRGTATIARVPHIASLAFAIEQVGSAIRDSELGWTPALGDTLSAAVSEVRSLVRSTTDWGDGDRARLAAVEAAVRRFMPNVIRPTPPMPSSTTQPVFIALQAAAVASDLEQVVRAAEPRGILDDVLNRVRTMQGVAGLHEYPPLFDVCDTVERAARQTVPDSPLTEREIDVFSAAAAVLRRASEDLRAHARPDPGSPEVRRFLDLVSQTGEAIATPTHVVPIDELFFQDAGPHLVSKSGAPPMTPERRFADEVVSRAEHVRRLIADARQAGDGLSRRRIALDLTSTLHGLERTARSFGAAQVAALCGDAARRRDLLSAMELDALDAAAALLLSPVSSIEDLERRVAVLTRRRHTPAQRQSSQGHSEAMRVTAATPTGRALQDLLASGIAGLRDLDEQLADDASPAVMDEEVVPIETLLYRGRAALLRAIHVRDALRRQASPDAESLRELYDLLDLARAE